MAQTQVHGGKVLRVEAVQEGGKLGADPVEQLRHFGGDDLDIKLLLKSPACILD